MACTVHERQPYADWFASLPEAAKLQIRALVGLLREHGVNLGAPQSSKIKGSKKLRELRKSICGDPYRVLYYFDRNRSAILLLGDNKGPTANDWYLVNVPIAERIMASHEAELDKLPVKGDKSARKSKGRRR